MERPKNRRGWQDALFCLVVLLLSAGIALLPTGFSRSAPAGSSEAVMAKVTAVDNAMVKVLGPLKHGEQQLTVKVMTGRFKGRSYETTNNLVGKMELDKVFEKGDRAFAVLDLKGGEVAYANVLDHFRLDVLAVLALLFFGMLVLYGGWIGLKAMLSFVFSGVVLFKLLLPAMLKGWDPIWITLAVVAAVTAVTLFLVAGLTRRAMTAFAGAMGGVAATCLLSVLVTRSLHIHGAVRPFTETLLYSGYGNLDLARLFMAGIFLASSGAVMDLAVDIAAAMDEVKVHHPGISRVQLVKSGFTVGRHVLGTMITTLLLAYFSGYAAMLMTFIAQGVPVANVLNMIYIASEIANTLVGSFGLVLVAPLTAIAGGLIMTGPCPSEAQETAMAAPGQPAEV